MTRYLGLFVLALSFTLFGCGGGTEDVSDAAPGDETAAARAVDETPPAMDATPAEDDLPEANRNVRETYNMTADDPDAVYTAADIAQQGNFLKLNFSELEPDDLNRVVHRFKTEHSVCTGCTGLYIEEILAMRPTCGQTLQVAKNIIREEKMRPPALEN